MYVFFSLEGCTLTLKKWSYLFFSTFILGGVIGILTGIVIGNTSFKNGFGDFFVGISENFLAGLMFSIISQMGFFAYLTLNYMIKSVIRSRIMWEVLQGILILVAFADLAYLRYEFFGKGGSVVPFILLPLVVLVISVIVAFFKVKATNQTAWIPTIFFMFVVTILEWIPALKVDNLKSVLFMLVPLLLCNTWQIMQLHRLVQKKEA